MAEVASNASKGEYYRIGNLVTGKELALDILFTEEAPEDGYFLLAKNIARGDINTDGNINVLDFIALNKKLDNTTGDLEIDDLNKDNNVDANDLIMLKKYLLGVIDNFTSSVLSTNETPLVV